MNAQEYLEHWRQGEEAQRREHNPPRRKDEMNEPTVTVNGQRLTEGEAMTIRVALNSFVSEMQQPHALGNDERGKAIAANYEKCANSILVKMSSPQPL